MDDKELPWPKKGEQLFKADSDWWHNACLNYMFDNWDLYADGYKRGADLLVEHISETHSNQDLLIYPIVFLYRQYIELELKILIRDGNALLGIKEDIPKGHKIEKLWEKCRVILSKIWPNDSQDDLDAVEEYIKQFSDKDPTSTAFRYPVDLEGNPSVPDVKHINVRNLYEIMQGLSSLFDGCGLSISHYIDVKREMESEFRD